MMKLKDVLLQMSRKRKEKCALISQDKGKSLLLRITAVTETEEVEEETAL